MRGIRIYLLSYYLTCGLLVPVYACLLYRVHTGSKFKFVIQTTWLLLISNIMAITFAFSNQMLDQKLEPTTEILFDVIQSIAIFGKDACFNEAHWKFAFQYYSGSRAMPYYLASIPIPEAITKRDSQLDTIFVTLNAFFPVLQAVAYYVSNTIAQNQPKYY